MQNLRLGGLGALVGALAMCFAAPPSASAQEVTLKTEKVLTFLGLDLPLRPGEQLVPIGNGGCSFVVFGWPTKTIEFYKKYWGEREWLGACRFGLAHGQGALVHKTNGDSDEQTVIYGTRIDAQVSSGFERQFDVFYSGTTLNDVSTKTVSSNGPWRPENEPASLASIEESWVEGGSIVLRTFNAAAAPELIEVSHHPVGSQCLGFDLDGEYKQFASEIKKTCGQKKNKYSYMLVRREGKPDENGNVPLISMKTCPMAKNSSTTACELLLRETLGKNYAEFDAIMKGSDAARSVMIEEIFARYAPLEQAVEARLAGRAEQPKLGGAAQ